MAVYKLFPFKDATLYSFYPNMNTGIDPITEVSNIISIGTTGSSPSTPPQVARFLTQFSTSEINNIINNKISGSEFDVFLKSFIATAQGISLNTSLEIFPAGQTWNNGTGTYLDSPIVQNGCSWNNSLSTGSGEWIVSGSVGTNFITSSVNIDYKSFGGGSWAYSASDGTLYKVTQSFDLTSQKDLNSSVKNIVKKWNSGSLENNGFLIKLEDNLEFDPSASVQPLMKFYGRETNTIYPPQLEFKWKDFVNCLTGSATSSIVDTTTLVSSLNENPGVFYSSSINRFRFNVAPKYPPRVWTTASQFTGVNYLPTSSYYAIKDLDTNEFVVDYDTTYTQLSSDANGNYFDVYMNGLEPERYYKILVKTTIDNSTLILDDNYYFKVING